MRTISAADANRNFSRLLRDVAAGEPVVVTSRGKPLVRMEAVDQDRDAVALREAEHERAWQDHLARLRAQPALGLGRITRDEIYDD